MPIVDCFGTVHTVVQWPHIALHSVTQCMSTSYRFSIFIRVHLLFEFFNPYLHLQVNHLGHFYLTLELLPIILSSAPDARIVFVSSDAHRIAFAFDVDNLQGQKGYDRMKQYGSSKLFNVRVYEWWIGVIEYTHIVCYMRLDVCYCSVHVNSAVIECKLCITDSVNAS